MLRERIDWIKNISHLNWMASILQCCNASVRLLSSCFLLFTLYDAYRDSQRDRCGIWHGHSVVQGVPAVQAYTYGARESHFARGCNVI